MTFNEYQKLADRTVNHDLDKTLSMELHALHGMAGEVGELHSLYQKVYQGHTLDEQHLKKELGDLLWFMAEFCICHEWNFDEIAFLNIEKLKARFPNGFEADKSLHRKAGDI